jgi:hypothetical protein
MTRVSGAVLAAAASLALTGCASFREDCHAPQEYQAAVSMPSLQVPEGLSAPQNRGALKIPDVGDTARKRGPGDPCLDEPPSFFPGRPKPGLRPADAPAAEAPRTADPAPAMKPPPPLTNDDDPPKP